MYIMCRSHFLLKVNGSYLDVIRSEIYLYGDNFSNLLHEHTHTTELAPVIVVMETVPKHKIQFYY